MAWTLRRTRQDGRIIFVREKDDRHEWYILSSGKTGTCSKDEMKRRASFVMPLCEDDQKMVEDGFNAS